MSFRSEDGRPAHRNTYGHTRERGDLVRASDAETGGRRRASGSRGGRVLLALILLALIVGGVLLWRSLGDQTKGTNVYEDSVALGTEPEIRIDSGRGQVRVEGIENLEAVEISARKYAYGKDPTSARERAAAVPVNLLREESTLTIEAGGRGTGADLTIRVPASSSVEIEAAAGSVEVSGIANNLTIRARNGDIVARNIRGGVNIEAPRGDAALEQISTETGAAEINVGTGDVLMRDIIVATLEAVVETGEATLSGRFSGSGRILVTTGSINLEVPPEDTRELDAEAEVGEVLRGDESQEEPAPQEGGR